MKLYLCNITASFISLHHVLYTKLHLLGVVFVYVNIEKLNLQKYSKILLIIYSILSIHSSASRDDAHTEDVTGKKLCTNLAPRIVLETVDFHGEENDTRHVEREEDDDGQEEGPGLTYLHRSIPIKMKEKVLQYGSYSVNPVSKNNI
jgi:hypothetical protein